MTPSTWASTTQSTKGREMLDDDYSDEESSPACSSPHKPRGVLFAAVASPLRTGDVNKQADVSSSPGNQEWKAEHDGLHGNLSMDSSITSSSSLCHEHEETGFMGSSSPSTVYKGVVVHWKALLWRWSRPKALVILLLATGIFFSVLTIVASMSIRHPNALTTEASLTARLLPRRHVRSRPDQQSLTLTVLAQGRALGIKQVTAPSSSSSGGDDLSNKKTRKERQSKRIQAKPRPQQKPQPRFEMQTVSEPLDWRGGNRDELSLETIGFYNPDRLLTAVKPRVSFLYDPQLSLPHAPHRHVAQYPADFTDQTQLYPFLDSNDERVKGMELRKPYVDRDCVPMADWQTTFHPSCNAVHELGLAEIGGNPEKDFDLFGKKGYWRNAWKVEMNQRNDVFVLKTLKLQHNFEEAHFEHDRVDAVAMERLTGSPHVIDIFGFCGHSVMTEYANGKRLGAVADRARGTPLARLQMAADIAQGLADVHGIDGEDKVSFVHLDINPANVVIVGDRLKLNDFNIGIIRRWNTTSNEACGFPAQFPNPQWRSPEEARNEKNLTEKVDVFSLGHIFYRLIAGAEPWNRLEPGGKPAKAQVNEKVQQGILPTIPAFVSQSANPEIVAIREAMLSCYRKDPKDRPSARQIANSLQNELIRLKGAS